MKIRRKWATAHYNCFNGENTIVIVEAENEIEALCFGIGNNSDFASQFGNIESAILYYSDRDIVAANPIFISII